MNRSVFDGDDEVARLSQAFATLVRKARAEEAVTMRRQRWKSAVN
jgi:hypothetical protein